MTTGNDFLVYDSSRTESIGTRVITYKEPGALSFYEPPITPPRRNFLPKGRLLKDQDRERQVRQILLHHDGHDTANETFRTLIHRGLSTHLIIDWEGVVWQPLALYDMAYHAAQVNEIAIGIDLNNPIHPDRQRGSKGHRPPPSAAMINGRRHVAVGYTDAQYRALVQVINGLQRIFRGIKAEAPIGPDGGVLDRKLAAPTAFSGVLGHWHVSATKWDPGPGFDWERVLIALRGNSFNFPVTLPGTENLARMPKQRALNLSEPYFDHIEQGDGGYFPLGAGQAWHTGVHLRVDEGTPVTAPANGQVVVARNAKPDLKLGSPNVVVIRHEPKVAGTTIKFFSVLSHLRYVPFTGDETKVPAWMRKLAAKGGEYNWTGPDRPPALPGFEPLKREDVALAEIPVEAGEVIGYVGTFNPALDDGPGSPEARPLLDFALVSQAPVLPDQLGLLFVDEDEDEDILCNARTVWRHVVDDPEALRGLTEGGYPVPPSVIQEFYQSKALRREFRYMAVKHATEWSARTDFTGLFGGGVEFEWYLERQVRDFLGRYQKFFWWDDEVTAHTGLPADRRVWAYHPIMLLVRMAKLEARKAFDPGDAGPVEGVADLDRARREDAALEAEQGEAHGHGGEIQVKGFDVDEARQQTRDAVDDAWLNSWDPGEWQPE